MARRPIVPQPSTNADADLVLLGEFGRPHGLRGEVRLKSHTGDPLAIAGYAPLIGSDGRSYTLTDLRPASGAAPDLLVVRVQGVADRTGAEALNRVTLSAPRARIAAPDEPDEFLLADLVGLAVFDEAGTSLGRVVAVPNFGGGDLVEIAPGRGGPTALLPFTRAFVPVVDITGGRLVAAPPEDLFAPPTRKPADDPG